MKRSKMVLVISFFSIALLLMGCLPGSEVREGPSAEQIKADLIGHTLTISAGEVWEFAALSEYEHFDIRDKQTQGNATEYDVSMRLVDIATGTHFLTDVLIVYRETSGKWELVSVVATVFERIEAGATQ